GPAHGQGIERLVHVNERECIPICRVHEHVRAEVPLVDLDAMGRACHAALSADVTAQGRLAHRHALRIDAARHPRLTIETVLGQALPVDGAHGPRPTVAVPDTIARVARRQERDHTTEQNYRWNLHHLAPPWRPVHTHYVP